VFDRVAAKPTLGALDGLNGTVFAYGQTGSGKTFTITGGTERYVDRGIVPRAVTKLFSEIARRANDGATYEVTVSYVEVYNDQAYDLLFDGANGGSGDDRRGETPNDDADVLNTRVHTHPKNDSSSFLPKVALLEDDDGVIHARGRSAHRAGSEEEALNLLFLGDVNRAVAETPMNLQSSRSHCVFTMVVERREPGALTVRRGKLNLVDLAGSERVGKSGVEELGALREAKHINLSLHALEKVVVALSDGDPHVPYRDSVMTMLLKDSLGGNCATAMVATVSPEFEHVFESISTCRFALRIASVRNALLVNEETDPKLVIKRLREENRALREELKLARGDADGGRDALSESELARLRGDVERFCGDDDAAEALDLGGSMLKIRAALGVFRELVNAARASGGRSRVYENETACTNDDVERTSEAAEAARLADVVRRRDEEIKALVAMLEKRASLPKVSETFASESFDAPRVSTLGDVLRGTGDEPDEIKISGAPAKPSTPEASSEPNLPPRRRFADRNAAFEHFKRAHAARGAVEANKKTLREQYATAKKLGEAVNASRTAIASMKSDIEKARVKRAFFAEPTACATGDHAHDSSTGGDSNETRALLRKVDEEKRAYKKNYDALRDLKKEIERVQSMLERSRGRVMREFEDWFGEGDSDGTRDGDAGDGNAGDPSTGNAGDGDAGVPSTGNAEADADIAAFYAARRKLLRSSREPSSRGSSRGGSSSRGSSEVSSW
jgi:kinesin family protein 6/9